MNAAIPFIPITKNYWLVRTQGGRFYSDFRKGNFIAINWDKVTIDEISELSQKELTLRISKDYPEKKKPSRTANQLRIFSTQIKQGDTVVITSSASNKLSIGEVLEDAPYIEYIDEGITEENNKICPYQKRKKVRWLKELHKWELDMELFKLLQHAQHTITDAMDYADLIEGLIHNYFVRGDQAQLVLQVKKQGKIPMAEFFPMGSEILDLARDFNKFSKLVHINIDDIDTRVNVNSPGKVRLAGKVMAITVLGMLLVSVTGGGVSVKFPVIGGGFDLKMNSIMNEITVFLDGRQGRAHKDILLKKYMNDLEVKTPDEIIALMNYLDNPDGSVDLKAIIDSNEYVLHTEAAVSIEAPQETKDSTSENE